MRSNRTAQSSQLLLFPISIFKRYFALSALLCFLTNRVGDIEWVCAPPHQLHFPYPDIEQTLYERNPE